MKNDSPINASVVFKNGKKQIFYGNRYEKEDIGQMVYNLRKMCLKALAEINVIQMFDNTIVSGDKLIFEYKAGIVFKNNLSNYLLSDFNPKPL